MRARKVKNDPCSSKMCFVSALATEGCSLFTGIRYTRSVKEAMNSVVWVPLYPGWPKKGTFKRSSFSAVWSVIISCIIVCPREERIPRGTVLCFSKRSVCVCSARESFGWTIAQPKGQPARQYRKQGRRRRRLRKDKG